MRETQCPVCFRRIQRNKFNQLLPHTRLEIGADGPMALICEGSTKGARAT